MIARNEKRKNKRRSKKAQKGKKAREDRRGCMLITICLRGRGGGIRKWNSNDMDNTQMKGEVYRPGHWQETLRG